MNTDNIQATGARKIGGVTVSSGSRRLHVPIYHARRLSLNGRNITPQVRGAFDGHVIVLTKYGTRKTFRHEVSHAIDFVRHGRISERGAREVGFSLRRPHPVGCRCPFHLGHKGKYRLTIRR